MPSFDAPAPSLSTALAPRAARLARASLALLAALVVPACAEGTTGTSSYEGDYAATEKAPAEEVRGAVPTAIEHARRALDRGQGPRALELSDEVLADTALTPDELDEARVVRARALAAVGRTEEAITLLESLLARHAKDRRWSAEQEADRALAELLVGALPKTSDARREPGEVAPFAKVLAASFPVEEEPGRAAVLHMSQIFLGGSDDVSDELGTWNVRGAVMLEQRERCALCDDVRSDVTTSRYGSWLGIPRARAALERSLVVVFADLESPFPKRYEDVLPMPLAELEGRLARGEGVFAAKARVGAPPVVLVAAPRAGQLAEVEAALAKATSLPTSPVTVALPDALRPAEIQGAVRGSFKRYTACYESLLARAPGVQGKLEVSFAIEAGKPLEVSAKSRSPELDQPFERCVLDAFGALSFPKSASRTTVTYPLAFSP
jgi:hypothetical protein